MAGIFISYRRGDSAGHAGRLFDRLKESFGHQRVFIDVEGIAPGVDFVQALDQAIERCDIVLAVIGAEWTHCKDENGKRRLDSAQDFVRLELAGALKRDKKVVPVLVQGAAMPREHDLPADLQALATRQAVELSDSRWDSDVAKLIRSLGGGRGLTLARWGAAAAALLAVLGALWWGQHPRPDPLAVSQPQSGPPPTPALDFRTVKPGQFFTQVYRVTNQRAEPLRIVGAQIEGEQSSAFRIDSTHCRSQPLPQGHECLLEIQFRPLAPGDHSAQVVVRDNQPGSPWRIDLSGRGAVVESAEARLSVEPRALAFAEQTVGATSPARRLIVSNPGEADARDFRYGFVGEHQDDFVFERQCQRGWLAKAERCELAIAFAPSAPGLRRAKLSVEFFGRASPLIVELSGQGGLPATTTVR